MQKNTNGEWIQYFLQLLLLHYKCISECESLPLFLYKFNAQQQKNMYKIYDIPTTIICLL